MSASQKKELKFMYIYLKGWDRDFLSTGSLPKHQQELELGKTEARSPELNVRLPCGLQEPNYLSDQLLPSNWN